jgi:hypothetical protein
VHELLRLILEDWAGYARDPVCLCGRMNAGFREEPLAEARARLTLQARGNGSPLALGASSSGTIHRDCVRAQKLGAGQG